MSCWRRVAILVFLVVADQNHQVGPLAVDGGVELGFVRVRRSAGNQVFYLAAYVGVFLEELLGVLAALASLTSPKE